MAKVAGILALAAVVACPLVSNGHGLRRSRVAVSYYYPGYTPFVAYYYPLPVYVAPPIPVCVPTIQPTPQSAAATTQPPPLAPQYAPPTPAPASGSQSSQKSLSSPSAASYGEALSFYDAYPVARRDPVQPAGDLAEVAFWNLTDRDLTIRVEGQAKQLPRGQSMATNLRRAFVWQVEGREPKSEALGRDEAALEIVIRR